MAALAPAEAVLNHVGQRIAVAGTTRPEAQPVRPGERAILYVELPLNAGRAVPRLRHRVQFASPDGVLDEARRSMYRILAGDPVHPQPGWGTPEAGTAAPSDVQDRPTQDPEAPAGESGDEPEPRA